MTASSIWRKTGALLALTGGAALPIPAQVPGPAVPAAPGALRTSPAAVAQARTDSLRRPYTAADVYFVSGMISHHAQAIKMAGWAPSHSAGDAIRRLCERIINAQQDEIVIMQNWLRDRLQPVPEPNPNGMKMVMNGVEHVMLMPGMLTPDQMSRLDRARGPDFDQLFLTLMIQHHQGAVEMVKELFAAEGAGRDLTTFKLASDINVDQTTEIARMQKLLAALLTSPQ